MTTRRLIVALACTVAVLGASMPTASAQEPPEAASGGGSPVVAGPAVPVLGEDFLLEGQWVASGVVWLDWDDVDAASGFELMLRSADGWVLLSGREPVGGVAAAFDGSSARVVGLPEGTAEYWFAVRARNVGGVSAWSHSTGVAVPEYAQAGPRW